MVKFLSLKFNIFFIIFFLLSLSLNAIEYKIYKGDGKLETIGKSNEYKTNPYNNESKNSLVIGGGIINSQYSNIKESTNNELDNFKINKNVSVAYLRKLPILNNKLSIGIEFGIFNTAKTTINNESFDSKSANQQRPQPKYSVDTNNLCNYLNSGSNSALKTLCDNNSGNITTCQIINKGGYSFACGSGGMGIIIDSSICSVPAYGSMFCNGGSVPTNTQGLCSHLMNNAFGADARYFQGVMTSNRCEFKPIMTPNPPNPPTENEVCQLYPHLCTPPSIDEVCTIYPSLCEGTNPPSIDEVCGLFPTLCVPPSMDEICSLYPSLCEDGHPPSIEEFCNLYPDLCASGGGGGNNNRTSINSNSYTAMFLVNYELFRAKYVGLSIECGLGAIYRDMKLRGAVNGSGQSVALAGKTGAVGSYYLTNSLAIGAGVHYVYMGDSQFKNLSGYDFTIKSSANINYSLQLRYIF